MQKRLLGLLSLVLLTSCCLTACSSHRVVIQEVQLGFARNDWREIVSLQAGEDLRQMQQEWSQWRSRSASPANQESPSYRLQVKFLDQEPLIFFLTHDLRLFNEELNTEYLPPPYTQQMLQAVVEQLRQQRFGQLLSWKEADRLLPRYSTFQLMDLDTGITWSVQRRAGSAHADIQPLTRQDTQKLKAVYGGQWSWDRRAVVVLLGDRRIAGSINGMPHGAGALQNGFPGHHCLHFWQSTTHTRSKPDPAHQVMVHKAAGSLLPYLLGLNPADLQLTMLEMAGQGETDILRLGIRNPSDSNPSQLAKGISNIKIWDSRLLEETADRLSIEYKLSVYYVDNPKEHRKTITVTSRYHEEWNRWLVEPDFLEQLVR